MTDYDVLRETLSKVWVAAAKDRDDDRTGSGNIRGTTATKRVIAHSGVGYVEVGDK